MNSRKDRTGHTQGKEPAARPDAPRRALGMRDRWDRRVQATGGLLLAVLIGLSACDDETGSSPIEPVERGTELVSAVDGSTLDRRKLERLRAFGQGCTFTVKDAGGRYRRIAVKRQDLPFDLPPIGRDHATGQSNGTVVTGVFHDKASPGMVGVMCYAPNDLTSAALHRLLIDSPLAFRWQAIFDRLATRRGVSAEVLQRPPSPESREFMYELIPALFASTRGVTDAVLMGAGVTAGGLATELANTQQDEIKCLMTIRAGMNLASSDGTTITCECSLNYAQWRNVETGELSEPFYFWQCTFGGSPASAYEPYELPPSPDGLPEEIVEDSDFGGTPPPDECNGGEPPPDDPDDGVGVDSLGREYMRWFNTCVETVTTVVPPPPSEPPLCDDEVSGCLKPLTASDKQMFQLIGVFVNREDRLCDSLFTALQGIIATEPPEFFKGDSTIPDHKLQPHAAAYNTTSRLMHIDEEWLNRARTDVSDTAAVYQKILASLALHEVAHKAGYSHGGYDWPYDVYPFTKFQVNKRPAESCVRY